MERFFTKLDAGQKVTIVALGDSITELTWHTRGRLCWCGYLQEALFETYGRNRCWVINSGRCGDTASGALSRLDEDVFRFAPDLVIVSFGMNDSVGQDIGVFRSSMETIIDRVRGHGDAEVLLRTPNPIVNPPTQYILQDGQTASRETAGMRVAEFAAVIVDSASAKDCPVVDHYSIWKREEQRIGSMTEEPNHLWLRMSDPVHPGALGHLAFFREMAGMFRVPAVFPWEAEELG